MSLGVSVRNRLSPPPKGAPTDTGTAFITYNATTGPLDRPNLFRSVEDFVSVAGVRDNTNAAAYDWIESFIREGGQRVYGARYDPTGDGTVDDALVLFDPALGPGQIAVPTEDATVTLYGKLLNHAAANNRFALLDANVDSDLSDLASLGASIPDDNNTYGALFGPFVTIPAPASVIGGNARQVQASAVIAALCNRADLLGNPNRAAAGRDFPLQYATGWTVDIPTSQRETLLNGGVNTFANVYGVLENYGFQTALEQNEDNPFWQANVARARMWLTAQCQSIGEQFMFKSIDGRGRLLGKFKGAIEGVLLDLYNADGLYGQTPADAFAVEVGVSVNTDSSIAQGEMHAVAEVRFSMHAKAVIIDLVTVPVTGRIAA